MTSISARPRKFKRTLTSAIVVPAGQGVMTDDGSLVTVTETQRRCSKCSTYKALDQFAAASRICKACISLYYRQQYQGRPSRDRSLRKNYGMTHDEYDLRWNMQGGVCAACGQAETSIDPRTKQTRYLAVDHDHATGCIRGLLCGGCNSALGHMKDDPGRIRLLLAYAERIQGLKSA